MNFEMDDLFGMFEGLNDDLLNEVIEPVVDLVEVLVANEKLRKLVSIAIDAYGAAWGRLHGALIDNGIPKEVAGQMLLSMVGSGGAFFTEVGKATAVKPATTPA